MFVCVHVRVLMFMQRACYAMSWDVWVIYPGKDKFEDTGGTFLFLVRTGDSVLSLWSL